MTIKAENFRLRWPLRLQLEGVTVLTAPADTMATLRQASLEVMAMPLLAMDVRAHGSLDDVLYKMGTPDSAIYLNARINSFNLAPASYNLRTGHVQISDATVNGADIDLIINPDDTQKADSVSEPLNMLIEAKKIALTNVHYRMKMQPTIDSIDAHIPSARLEDGVIDLANSKIDGRLLQVDSIDVCYMFPPATDSIAQDSAVIEPDSISKPWQINAGTLALSANKAVYAMTGATPQPGLDLNYIQVSDVYVRIDSFYNCGTTIKVPLSTLKASERSGVKLSADGTFEMDSSAMYARNFNIETIFSKIKLDAVMGLGNFSSPQGIPLTAKLDAKIGAHDIDLLYPSLKPVLEPLPTYNDIVLSADVSGTSEHLNINKLQVSLPECITLAANGSMSGISKPDNMNARVSLHGSITQPAPLKPLLAQLSPNMALSIPKMELNGMVLMNRGVINGNLQATTESGDIALDAIWNGRLTNYNLDLKANTFPINAFLPDAGLGHLTATATVNGHGFNPQQKSTHIDADVTIVELPFKQHTLKDVRMWARLNSGNADAGIVSFNTYADFDVTVSGNLDSLLYNLDIDGDIRRLDLKKLGLSETDNGGSLSMGGHVTMHPDKQNYDANIKITAVDWVLGNTELSTPEITTHFTSTDSTVTATIDNETLAARFDAACNLDSLLASFSNVSTVIDTVMSQKRVHIDSIHHALPVLSLNINSGSKSIINGFLTDSKITYKGFSVSAKNDSAIHMDAQLTRLKSPSFVADTITMSMQQQADSLLWSMRMDNRPGTMDDFAHVKLSGDLSPTGLRASVNQKDISNKTGYKIGTFIEILDSVIYMRLTPEHPVIAYKEWSVNKDNYISYDINHMHFEADLQANCGNSYLQIKTNHDHSGTGHSDDKVQDIDIHAANIQLGDWLSLSPFAPPITGLAGADINIIWDPQQKSLTGDGFASLTDLNYGGERVGSFDLGFGLSTNSAGVIHASTSLMVDSVKVITATGALNDSTAVSPMLLDFSMIHFPLSIVNPFLPPGMARLRGMLNGEMDVTGSLSNPQFNGFVQFDSAAVRVDMLGTDFTFPDDKIPMDSNVVVFNNYAIRAVNDNPLSVNGTVNLKSIAEPLISLKMAAKNMQIIGSSKKRGQDVYGKAYIDANANVKGNKKLLFVDAKLNLLSGSNFTYLLNTTAAQINQGTDQNSVVRFVEFADTASIAQADSIGNTGMALMLNAALTISEGTTINVELSGSSQDKVQIQGAGNMTFSMSPYRSMRLTGRYNIESGFARYTPPLISQKTFQFKSGSYVAFNGDIMNPILNIHATDQIRANVTEEGQNSRLVNFLVGVSVTNTLANMDVKFDLSTNDDITVQNELQAMSPEQRANQAMNMLLYNVYTGPGTKASSTMPSNPLYSFLASKLNSWAANSIKGVDIQFGVDQYDRTFDGSTSTATSYSYKVSKALFNDRFKINVGGNYTTDAGDNENPEQSLINDVSMEYMLNKAGTMYIKLFRHVGYESILEGEVTQTGLGFVYKRKLNSLSEMFFPWRHRRPKVPEQKNSETDTVTINPAKNDTANK